MFAAIAKRLFGSANDRFIKSLGKTVDQINALEASVEPLTDEALAQRTVELRERLTKGETLDDILPDAFATVREAAKRAIGQRHFDVQLLGGIVLHRLGGGQVEVGDDDLVDAAQVGERLDRHPTHATRAAQHHDRSHCVLPDLLAAT